MTPADLAKALLTIGYGRRDSLRAKLTAVPKPTSQPSTAMPVLAPDDGRIRLYLMRGADGRLNYLPKPSKSADPWAAIEEEAQDRLARSLV